MQDFLEGLAFELGLLVAFDLLEAEVSWLCGVRYRRRTEPIHTRYGRQGLSPCSAVRSCRWSDPTCEARTAAAKRSWRSTPSCSRRRHAQSSASPHCEWRQHSGV